MSAQGCAKTHSLQGRKGKFAKCGTPGARPAWDGSCNV